MGQLPCERGAYAVYHDGVLVYVGSSARLQKRLQPYLATLRNEKRPRRQPPHSCARRRVGDGVVVTIKVTPSQRLGDWLMREYRLIHRLKPRDNRQWTGQYSRRAAVPDVVRTT